MLPCLPASAVRKGRESRAEWTRGTASGRKDRGNSGRLRHPSLLSLRDIRRPAGLQSLVLQGNCSPRLAEEDWKTTRVRKGKREEKGEGEEESAGDSHGGSPAVPAREIRRFPSPFDL